MHQVLHIQTVQMKYGNRALVWFNKDAGTKSYTIWILQKKARAQKRVDLMCLYQCLCPGDGSITHFISVKSPWIYIIAKPKENVRSFWLYTRRGGLIFTGFLCSFYSLALMHHCCRVWICFLKQMHLISLIFLTHDRSIIMFCLFSSCNRSP